MTVTIPDGIVHATCYLQGHQAAERGEQRNCWWLKGEQHLDWERGYDDHPRTRQNRINAKRALLRVLDKELDELAGRLLSDEEGLRLRSITEEQDRLENELREFGVEP